MSNSTLDLIAAPFTPFHPDRSLNLDAIDSYVQWLIKLGVKGAFVCGTTGEGALLTVQERKSIAQRWVQVASGQLRIIVHVGHLCLADCRELAAHAQAIGANGTSCLAPFFFKPLDHLGLVDWCQQVAEAAPELPFYYYHIPSMTGFPIQVHSFLDAAAGRIPNLAGVKFTHDDMSDLKLCVNHASGKNEIFFGRDEKLLAAIQLGVQAAVGSTYNYAAPLYLELNRAFHSGDLAQAQQLQALAVQMIDLLGGYGGSSLALFKRFMSHVAVECGPTRLPLVEPDDAAFAEVLQRVDASPLKKWLLA
ncbi:MAG TPA: dihydrodipicolinate synthetase [Planctomycetaceae bacterium]|nr:dihydrodipicolinate synthetase [Planctomycetaceae bacterium]